jgi:predicted HTH transcriptional regulator
MHQGRMFDWDMHDQPVVRPSNPLTSYEGETDVTESGRRKSYMVLLFKVIRRAPGLTKEELSEKTNLPEDVIGKRLSDLQNVGYIHKGAVSKRSSRGRSQSTWWPNEP